MGIQRTFKYSLFLFVGLLILSGCPTDPPGEGKGEYVVLGYNDLGMHCMNQDFGDMMILPPFNTLHAQVIRRNGHEPDIITSGITIEYTIPGNTTSVDKTDFWDHDVELFGVDLPDNVGLTGNGLSGTMTYTGNGDWNVTGIPVTPIMDDQSLNPYPLAEITVKKDGVEVAQTHAVVPVSWEISCNLCHDTPGKSVNGDILSKHDEMHDTDLMNSKPVACMNCHGQEPLGTHGDPSLSHAMHGSHADRMDAVVLQETCYACHPGQVTQCQRDIHYSEGVGCVDCHGDMAAVANPARRPWIDEPRCDDCHDREEFEFEPEGVLYRNAKGHQGIHCAACHGSPHAITPTVTEADNVQAIEWQGHPGVIDTCTVCHEIVPGKFEHHRDEGEIEEEDEDDDKKMSLLERILTASK